MLFNNPGAEQILCRLPAWMQRSLLHRWIEMSPFNAANLPNLAIATIPVDVVVGSLMSGKVVWRAARVDVV